MFLKLQKGPSAHPFPSNCYLRSFYFMKSKYSKVISTSFLQWFYQIYISFTTSFHFFLVITVCFLDQCLVSSFPHQKDPHSSLHEPKSLISTFMFFSFCSYLPHVFKVLDSFNSQFKSGILITNHQCIAMLLKSRHLSIILLGTILCAGNLQSTCGKHLLQLLCRVQWLYLRRLSELELPLHP